MDATGRPRWAAVAIVERRSELLLIRRARRPGDPWSGDWAFPGGFGHAGDVDPAFTARREAREEVGLELGAPRRELGRRWIVDPWRARLVQLVPVVFDAPAEPVLRLADGEVAEARWVARGDLARKTRQWRWIRGVVPYPAAVRALGDGVVWGLTGAVLDDLLG